MKTNFLKLKVWPVGRERVFHSVIAKKKIERLNGWRRSTCGLLRGFSGRNLSMQRWRRGSRIISRSIANRHCASAKAPTQLQSQATLFGRRTEAVGGRQGFSPLSSSSHASAKSTNRAITARAACCFLEQGVSVEYAVAIEQEDVHKIWVAWTTHKRE